MKKRTRKQTADIVMGILLQILFFFPWMICDGKRYTIHGYLLKVLLNNDYVETYDTFFYPGVQGIAEYTRPIATGFLLVMIGLVTVQVVELIHLYLSWRGEKFPQIQGAIWVLGMIATSVIGDLAYSEKTMETYLTRGVYIYAFSFLIIEGLWIFMGKWTELWDSQETEHKMQIRKKEQEVLLLFCPPPNFRWANGGQYSFYSFFSRQAGTHKKSGKPRFHAFLFASSAATAQATVAPTIGLVPIPIKPIIST